MPDERSSLLSYLAQQRYVLRLSAYGLSDEQARETPARSPLSIGGLIKHVATTERGWIDLVVQRSRESGEEDYFANLRMGPEESLADILRLYDEVAQETEQVITSIPDLNQPVPIPKGVPWYPSDIDAWSVRWVLLHLIEETARHAGHADIIREAIDGATAMPLMAAAEGWPSTPWLQPWEATP
jgi:uncharacterized damage-inducible protein DinB